MKQMRPDREQSSQRGWTYGKAGSHRSPWALTKWQGAVLTLSAPAARALPCVTSLSLQPPTHKRAHLRLQDRSPVSQPAGAQSLPCPPEGPTSPSTQDAVPPPRGSQEPSQGHRNRRAWQGWSQGVDGAGALSAEGGATEGVGPVEGAGPGGGGSWRGWACTEGGFWWSRRRQRPGPRVRVQGQGQGGWTGGKVVG